jgi:DNA-binding PadR family transcriptional regulator
MTSPDLARARVAPSRPALRLPLTTPVPYYVRHEHIHEAHSGPTPLERVSPGRGSAGSDRLLPLTPITFEVLLALAGGPAHGYGIMKAVAERTGGGMDPHPGTLYRALARLVEEGLVTEMAEGRSSSEDERRRYYALTQAGRAVAAAEARRLERAVADARVRRLLPGEGT